MVLAAPTMYDAVDEAAALYEAETVIRDRASALAANPAHDQEVARLTTRADDLQHRRLALLRHWKLI
jgi:hypothetical protein